MARAISSGFFGRLLGSRRFLPAALVPLILGFLGSSLAMIVDPYDLRPWGPVPVIGDYTYPLLEGASLVRAVTGQRHALLVVGGSTAMPIRRSELNGVFGEKEAENIAYSSIAPTDAAATLRAALHTPGLRRILMSVDFTEMRNDGLSFPPGQRALTVLASRWHDEPDFDRFTLRASFERLRTGVYGLSNWRRESRAQDALRLTSAPDILQPLLAAAAHPSPDLLRRPVRRPCSDYVFIRQVLVPIARDAARKGVAFDLFFPPMPYQRFALWQVKTTYADDWRPGSRAMQLADFHACIASEAARLGLSNVTVHATDLDDAIADDLGNFRDSVHLNNPAAVRGLLVDIRDRRFVLAADRTDAYRHALLARIARVIGPPRL